MTKTEISILIPTYNCVCVQLVGTLQAQASALGLDYEIVVADDGSTDLQTVQANRAIDELPGCRYVVRGENVGRAGIRNFLATQARHKYLLFVDSDMTAGPRFSLARYMDCEADTVIDGGVSIVGDPVALRGNLRYLYEKAAEASHTAEQRQRAPYQSIHTANLLVRRDIMTAHPFDRRFRRYGYEDVLFGKTMKTNGIPICHIDNPMDFDKFETNSQFVSKTEEGLTTLHTFRHDLRGYNRLLTLTGNIHFGVIRGLIRLWHCLMGGLERRWLCSSHPSLRVFNMYKLGYYLSLTDGQPSPTETPSN